VLEPWIIEQIRRREEETRRRNERPRLEIPIRDERWKPDPDRSPTGSDDDDQRDDEEKPERGVVIIDMSGTSSDM
jgi:hypothetical protein